MAHAGSWHGVGRIKAILAHCKWRRENVPVANTALPEKWLQNTVDKGHMSDVGLSSQPEEVAGPKHRRASAEWDVYKGMMAGLINCFSNGSVAYSHMRSDPEAHTDSCVSIASPHAGLCSLLLLCGQLSPAARSHRCGEEDAVSTVTCSKVSLSKPAPCRGQQLLEETEVV